MTKTFMFLPAGTHTITPSQNGRPVTVNIEVTPESASAMQKQLELLTADGQRPYISTDANNCIAAFRIIRFFWKDDGVYCEAEQICDDDVLKGKACGATFYVDKISAIKTSVICNEDATADFGFLQDIKDVCFKTLNPTFSVVVTPDAVKQQTK